MKARCIKDFIEDLNTGDTLLIVEDDHVDWIVYRNKHLCDVGSPIQEEYFEIINDSTIIDYKQMWNELKVKLSEQYDMCLEKEILGVYNTMIEMENE